MSNWYWKYLGREGITGKYIAVGICERCGKEFQNDNVAASKYCPECSKIVQAEQNRERVRRYRERQKQNKEAKNV